jgi:hypothetical protein
MPRRQPGVSGQHWRYLNRHPTIAEIECGVSVTAYVVKIYGERHAPVMDSLDAALEEAWKRGGCAREVRSWQVAWCRHLPKRRNLQTQNYQPSSCARHQ